MNLTCLTPEKIEIGKENDLYTATYTDVIPYGSPTDVVLFIEDKNPRNFTSSQCGCLTVTGVPSDSGITVNVKYNSKIKGIFRKKSTMTYQTPQGKKEIKVQFRGEVKS